jgi:hypothetical protein
VSFRAASRRVVSCRGVPCGVVPCRPPVGRAMLIVLYRILQNLQNLQQISAQSVELYRVSQEECARLREGVPYVKEYRYNPKHLCPNLNGYGDNG